MGSKFASCTESYKKQNDFLGYPVYGSSWEGFIIESPFWIRRKNISRERRFGTLGHIIERGQKRRYKLPNPLSARIGTFLRNRNLSTNYTFRIPNRSTPPPLVPVRHQRNQNPAWVRYPTIRLQRRTHHQLGS